MTKEENTTLSYVNEIGVFGSMDINDPTAIPVGEINLTPKTEAAYKYIKEEKERKEKK